MAESAFEDCTHFVYEELNFFDLSFSAIYNSNTDVINQTVGKTTINSGIRAKYIPRSLSKLLADEDFIDYARKTKGHAFYATVEPDRRPITEESNAWRGKITKSFDDKTGDLSFKLLLCLPLDVFQDLQAIAAAQRFHQISVDIAAFQRGKSNAEGWTSPADWIDNSYKWKGQSDESSSTEVHFSAIKLRILPHMPRREIIDLLTRTIR